MNQTRARARELRRNPTHAERALWQKLRLWQVEQHKFRRQQPLGSYIVDFVCLEKRLIIELDGGQHAEQKNYDNERDTWLRDQGFVVLRFWNNEVLGNIAGVMETIYNKLQNTPYLGPSLQGGRRKTTSGTYFSQTPALSNDRSVTDEPHLKSDRSRRHLGICQ